VSGAYSPPVRILRTGRGEANEAGDHALRFLPKSVSYRREAWGSHERPGVQSHPDQAGRITTTTAMSSSGGVRPIPSKSLASVYGLIAECAEARVLGPDVE